MLDWECSVGHEVTQFLNWGNIYIINKVKNSTLNRTLQETNSATDGVTDELRKI